MTTRNKEGKAITAAELVRLRQQERKRRKVYNTHQPTQPSTGTSKLMPHHKPERKLDIALDNNTSIAKEVDIDNEIARLEAELARSDSSKGDSSVDDDYDEERSNDGQATSVNKKSRRLETSPVKSNADGIVCLSKLKEDRIESLPTKYLPKAAKKSDSRQPSQKAIKPGLEKAVQEVLTGYVPRSSERLPFYCRFCQMQCSNEQEFFQHKSSQFHTAAEEAERRASYCKLCRKQLTSPAQLKEHLVSKPHKERLERLSRSTPRHISGRKRQNYSSNEERQNSGSTSTRQFK